MTDLVENLPPLTPQGETVVADEPLFVAACKAAIADDAQRFGWSFGNSLLTRSEKWGLVWRVDFNVRGRSTSSRFINRAMCWGEKDGTINGKLVAFAQQVSPLA